MACLPGLAAVLVLALCANGIGRRATAAAVRPPVAARPAGAPHTAPKPHIVPRSAWLDALSRHAQPPPRYDDKVVAVFVHHTDSPNGYDCADAPRIIRYLYAGQTGVRDWDDIGYNFLVDHCGTIYEGRAGVSTGPSRGRTRRGSIIGPLGSRRSGRSLRGWRFPGHDRGDRRVGCLEAGTRGCRSAGEGAAGVEQQPQPVRVRQDGRPPCAGGTQGRVYDKLPGAALSARLPEVREAAARLQGALRGVAICGPGRRSTPCAGPSLGVPPGVPTLPGTPPPDRLRLS